MLDLTAPSRDIIAQYTVGLLALDGTGRGMGSRPSGSGTLVDFGGSLGALRGILTASHVAAALRAMKEFGIVRFRSSPMEYLVCRGGDAVEVVALGGEHMGEGGPDIAFVRLPTEVEDALVATNVFFKPMAHALAVEDGAKPPAKFGRIAVGMLGEASKALPTVGSRAQTEHTSLIGVGDIREYRTGKDGASDSFVFRIKHHDEFPPPGSYGGLSGGGVWQVGVGQGPENRTLIGVPFFETMANQQGERDLICNGVRTTYELLVQAVLDRFDPEAAEQFRSATA